MAPPQSKLEKARNFCDAGIASVLTSKIRTASSLRPSRNRGLITCRDSGAKLPLISD
jgi:hypothetical protein